MNKIEQLKSKILLEVLGNELEYHFDINYNSEMAFTERKKSFPLLVNEYVNMPLLKLIQQYGIEYFNLTEEEIYIIEIIENAEKA